MSDLLADLIPDQAGTRTIPSAHSIWDLVLHLDLWARIALDATQGIPMPRLYGTEKDWPAAINTGAEAWAAAKSHLFETAENLAQTIEAFADARLSDTVPGREYDFYYLFHGVIQHSLYHAGQIALLRRAAGSATA